MNAQVMVLVFPSGQENDQLSALEPRDHAFSSLLATAIARQHTAQLHFLQLKCECVYVYPVDG